MKFVYMMMMTVLSGCATHQSPCDFDGAPVACEASIDVENGQLVLLSPACSAVRVVFDDREQPDGARLFKNVDGRLRIGKSNEGAALIKGTCRAYPPRP